MRFVDYYDQRDKDLQDWYVVVVERPSADLLSEHVNWLSNRPSKRRFFLQPMSAAFWFEDSADALLYHLHYGDKVRTPVKHDPAGIKKCMKA